MDGGESAARVIAAPQELSGMVIAQGRKVENTASSLLLPQHTQLSVSVESQSHQPLNPHAGQGQVQHTQLLQKPQSEMRCTTGDAWLPRDNPAPSSCIS